VKKEGFFQQWLLQRITNNNEERGRGLMCHYFLLFEIMLEMKLFQVHHLYNKTHVININVNSSEPLNYTLHKFKPKWIATLQGAGKASFHEILSCWGLN
jgi:hypothetical protein